MNLETFTGRDTSEVFARARRALGEDVMIVRTTVRRDARGPVVEVVAVAADEVDRFRERLAPDPLPLLQGRGRPWVTALVGPTGAGKTTTLAKLATHPRAFGERRVGLLTVDTYRVGALEQLNTFAEIAGLPLEVVYSVDEAAAALKRLSRCEVVLVDTPGRSPRADRDQREWAALLEAVAPDETHLVLPATLRLDVAEAAHEVYAPLGADHLLLTKLDEVPGETGLAALADRIRLPVRWATDGQEIPADLRPAAGRILASVGLDGSAEPVERVA